MVIFFLQKSASLKLARDSYSITQTIRNEKKREREEGRAEGMANQNPDK